MVTSSWLLRLPVPVFQWALSETRTSSAGSATLLHRCLNWNFVFIYWMSLLSSTSCLVTRRSPRRLPRWLKFWGLKSEMSWGRRVGLILQLIFGPWSLASTRSLGLLHTSWTPTIGGGSHWESVSNFKGILDLHDFLCSVSSVWWRPPWAQTDGALETVLYWRQRLPLHQWLGE